MGSDQPVSEPTVEQRHWDAAAALLGFRDWADATDYRNSGEMDRKVAATVKAFARFERDLLMRPPVVDGLEEALAAAYTAGATDVHEWWVAGNVEREADFGEAASDYARSIDLTALAMRPAPASDDVVEANYRDPCNCPDQGKNGHHPLCWDANLPKPTEQATSPAPDAVLRERVNRRQLEAADPDQYRARALLAEAPEQVRHARHCAGWNRGDEECDCGAVDYLARIDAALASSKPTGEREREEREDYQ